MAEQQNVPKVGEKEERSRDYINCKLSYDCLMSSTKSFIHNFNNLTVNEKLEFRCMGNYVKQLEKCMVVIKNNTKPVIHQVKPKIQKEEPEQAEQTAKPKVAAKPKIEKKKKEQTPVAPTEPTPTPAPAGPPANMEGLTPDLQPVPQVAEADQPKTAPTKKTGGKKQ